ncbi:MAG: M50 family metallopeptidase [Oscillospiraceae bacterium]|nr:M50 family metallopeptidase [Oscillospiraceae bacterium]
MDILIKILLIFIGILFFSLIILIHEFGHFFTAKLSGVRVNEFALGMGPKILKFQRGETLYTLRLFPIGGFCAMEGEDEESEKDGSFRKAAVWKRMIIIVAGALLNVLLGLILTIVILVQRPYFNSTTVDAFKDTSVSQRELSAGDRIESVNGYKISTFLDLNFAIMVNFKCNKNSPVTMVVNREGKKITLNKVEFDTEKADDGKELPTTGFLMKKIDKNFGTVLAQSAKYTISNVRTVWESLSLLITGKLGINDVAGPIGMISGVGKAATDGLQENIGKAINNITQAMMSITVNLGVFNLLPFPALDGGRFVFLLIESIRKKPINPKYEGIIHAVGFILVLALMAVCTFSDVFKIFRRA